MDKKKLLHFVSWILTFYFCLSVFLFIIHLIAPLLGGKLYFSALIIYGSWIGLALLSKHMLKNTQREVRLKGYKFLLLTLYFILCAFLWFPYPLNIFFSGLGIVGNLVGYKAQLKSFKL